MLAPLAEVAPDLDVPGVGRVRTVATASIRRVVEDGGMSPAPAKPQDEVEIVQTPHRFVVVEGPIGVGKTSLARRLAASFGSDLVLEQGEENPFLERFYRNPRAAAFQTQLYFLFQRARQMQELRQHDLFAARARRGLPAREGPPVRAA